MIRSMNRLKAEPLTENEIKHVNGGDGAVFFPDGTTLTCPLNPDPENPEAGFFADRDRALPMI